MLISTIGASMIWPFLMIYVSERLSLPLTSIASLMTINALMSLLSSFIAGPISDRVGRKGVMIVSLAVNGLQYILMSQAHTLLAFALLMGLSGAFNPLYRVGADAMMADLIVPEKRVDAYSMMRMSNNLGVALGPAIGGFIASSSYTVAFLMAAAGMITYSLLLLFFAQETLPRELVKASRKQERFGGYGRIFGDSRFMSLVGGFTLIQMTSVILWVLLSVYTKTNFNMPERQYGLLPTTNALMVVFFQIYVTKITKRYPPLQALVAGAFFYAIGVGSVALGHGFAGFWISMVIATIGELIAVPTSTTYAANLAPPEMRGRYMSIYGLTWPVAAGIGPVIGGFLNDHYGPVTIWYGAFVIGMIATIAFLLLQRILPKVPLPAVTGD